MKQMIVNWLAQRFGLLKPDEHLRLMREALTAYKKRTDHTLRMMDRERRAVYASHQDTLRSVSKLRKEAFDANQRAEIYKEKIEHLSTTKQPEGDF